ncbi:MAG: S1C family serine protease [Pirellulales bacterium]
MMHDQVLNISEARILHISCSKTSNWVAFALKCFCFMIVAVAVLNSAMAQNSQLGSLQDGAVSSEIKTVKIYGAGGLGLDHYQSGFFISAEGHILTVWSTVLDVSEIIVVSSDGRRMKAQIFGIDPNLELAVLKADQAPPAYFSLAEAVDATVGERVLAISNLFSIAAGSEMSSFQKGVVMTITDLKARRGNFQSVYQGPALIIDAMSNNPGAAGGALVNIDGKLLGILGKELRDTNANIWINYALPVAQFKQSVQTLLSGKSIARATSARKVADRPATLAGLGIVLIPNILPKTPAYVDLIQPSSRAAKAGLQSDDLILFINSQRVASQGSLVEELSYMDRGDQVVLLVQRGSELKEVIVRP